MSLSSEDSRYVWHPFTPMQAYASEAAPVIVAGEGFDLIDESGQRYLDGVSSLWCNVHGHRVPEIDRAIKGQLDRIAHSTLLGLGSDASIELAKRLVETTPAGLDHVFFSDSGVAGQLKRYCHWTSSRISSPHQAVFLFSASCKSARALVL